MSLKRWELYFSVAKTLCYNNYGDYSVHKYLTFIVYENFDSKEFQGKKSYMKVKKCLLGKQIRFNIPYFLIQAAVNKSLCNTGIGCIAIFLKNPAHLDVLDAESWNFYIFAISFHISMKKDLKKINIEVLQIIKKLHEDHKRCLVMCYAESMSLSLLLHARMRPR